MGVSRTRLTGAGVALVALDAVLTVAAVQFLGATESNPLLAGAIGAVGLHTAMLLRLSLGTMVLVVLDVLATHTPPRAGLAALLVAVTALVGVTVSNGVQIGTQLLAS
ncbi:MAG: DUF5658 family protein [Nitriliruptorales bacterium]|nr:DUF5658 family protein [Nitriliruptorales bacterium]